MTAVQLRTLGECALETETGRIGPDSRYVFALGLYLVLERGKRIPRQALVDMLWPDVGNDRLARHRFRQTLLRLKQLGVPVATDKSHLRLERAAAAADFEQLLNVNGEAEEVLNARDSFEFLQGYQPRISEQFATWLDLHRARVELAIQRVFVHALKSARTRGDWTALEHLALTCLSIDPLNEEATMARAEATAMRGSKTQALRILDSYMDALGERSLSIGLPAKMLRSRIAERMTQPQYMTLSEAHFVGREEEVALLTGMLDEARHGRGGAIRFVGEAGIGKTRLVTEMTRIAALKGISLAAVDCQPVSADRPIGLLADIVTALRGLPGSIGASVESLTLLQRLTEHTAPAPTTPHFGEPTPAGSAIRRAVFDLFDAVAEENVLLVIIEDAHWADAFSWRMIETIAESAARRHVVFLATARVAPAAEAHDDARAPDPFAVRQLPPLSPTVSETLIHRLLEEHESEVSEEMRSWCVSVAEGNPYYLRELLTHWLETQEPFGVPKSLAALIDRRLARLSPVAMRLFQACVALGGSSSLAHIEKLAITEPSHLLPGLEELSLAGLITSDTTTIQPKHDLLAQAARERLPDPVSALMHRRIATMLEEDVKDRSEPSALWECAHHWRMANDTTRAVTFLDECGRHLIAVGLPEEAASLYRRAMHLEAADPPHLLRLHEGLIRALRYSGLLEQVLKEASALRLRALAHGRPLERHSDIELMEVEARWRREGSSERLVEHLSACLLASDASCTHKLDAAFWLLAVAHSMGYADAARRAWSAVEALVNSGHDPIRQFQLAMVYHTDYGDMKTAVDYAQLAVDRARQRDDALLLLRVLRNAALTLRRAGRRGEARSLLYDAFDIASRHHAALQAVDCAHMQASIAIDEGEEAMAAMWLCRATEWITKCESPSTASEGLMTHIRLAIMRGDWHDAQTRANELPDWRDERNRRWKQMILSLHLTIASHAGDQDLVKALLPEAEASFETFATLGQQDYAAEALARAYQSTGEIDRAREVTANYFEAQRRDVGEPIESLRDLARVLGVTLPDQKAA